MVDSIFNLFHIHAVNYPNTSDIFVDVSKRSLWAQNLYHDSLYAGNDTLDNLVNQYGLYYTSVSAFVNNDYIFDILSSYPINMRPIVNEISSMTDIITVFDDNIYLDNSDIILVDSGFVRHYTFRYGTGDCESGCTINYYWKFSVYGDCVVQFDTSYGFGNSTLGVKETTISSLNLYPNPTSKVVYIELSEELSNHGILRLITAAGSIIKEMNINSPKMNLDVSGLSPGVYEAVLFSDNSVVRKKLVIYQP